VRQRQQASGSGRALAGDQRRAPRRGREWYADGREGSRVEWWTQGGRE
jgi:hypothetical protein